MAALKAGTFGSPLLDLDYRRQNLEFEFDSIKLWSAQQMKMIEEQAIAAWQPGGRAREAWQHSFAIAGKGRRKVVQDRGRHWALWNGRVRSSILWPSRQD